MTWSDNWALRLGFGRILVFGIWMVSVVTTPVTLYSELPREIFHPPGALMLFPDAFWDLFLSPAVLLGFQGILVMGCAACAAGVRPFRPIALGTVVLLILFDGLMKGWGGFINHAQMGILYGAILLSMFPSSDQLSVYKKIYKKESSYVYHAGILSTAGLFTFAYAFIGTRRIVVGGLEIFTGDAILTHFAVQSLNYSSSGIELGLLVTQHAWLAVTAKVGFAVITVLEVLAPLCLLSRRFTVVWLSVMIPFHFSTLPAMNIFFWENVLLLLFFLPAVHVWSKASLPGTGTPSAAV